VTGGGQGPENPCRRDHDPGEAKREERVKPKQLALLDFGAIATTDAAGVTQHVPVPGALIVTDDGTNVLVDAGMPARYIGSCELVPHKANRMRAVMEERHTARHQLALVGLRSEDIDCVMATHFDWDHAGANADFPAATFFVERNHLEAARADPDRFWPELWDIPGLRYNVLDGDAEPVPGIRVLVTGGHVPGHLCLLVACAQYRPRFGARICQISGIDATAQQAESGERGTPLGC
jgi:N-acyl homoserine lactone hydrolase